ncbi:MAG: cation acetate symporter [Robiginitomaculum sp.]|nr:MAG: cation acetate symporter [Robiginitomaculum sp.]
MYFRLIFTFLTVFSINSFACASTIEGEVTKQETNIFAIAIFFVFALLTLAITWWAARQTNSKEAFYTASGGVSPLQNALAIAGDFMSAATLLGITGLMFFRGYDGYILSFGIIVGWAVMLMIIAERFRNLGRFTFVDVISYRLEGNSVRVLMALCSLVVIVFYLIGQMVGAGKLIQLLFGLDYIYAIIIVSILMVLYVSFGGMIATTWVQMIKAILLLGGGAFISFALLSKFDFSFSKMLEASVNVHPKGQSLLEPGGWLGKDSLNVWTVGLTMCFGIMGLPHILMRFFTVKNAAGARKSVAYATMIMSVFYIFILIIGLGAVALLWGQPEYYDDAGKIIGGSNMVALHTAKALGGDFLFGFMSAVAFATILAVVAGLTLAASAAIAHDLYAVVMKKGLADPKIELRISKISVIVVGIMAVILGIVFETQNIAVVTAFALAIAASVNFPLLLLSMYWRGLTSRGAVIGGGLTFIFTIIIIVLSDSIWVQVLGNETAIFPYVYPTVFTMPVGFILVWLFSVMDRSQKAKLERSRFDAQFVRSETGIGADEASQH